jgi:hypothetical protein
MKRYIFAYPNKLVRHLGPSHAVTYDNEGKLHFLHWIVFLFGTLFLIGVAWLIFVYLPLAVIALITYGFH